MSKSEDEIGCASALRAGGTLAETVAVAIADKVHKADCGCNSRVHPQDQWDYYGRIADAVMELFPEAEARPADEMITQEGEGS